MRSGRSCASRCRTWCAASRSRRGSPTEDDWYPLSFVQPISKIISAVRGAETVHITCHPHCSLGTYLFIEQGTGRPVPITRFVDIEGMFKEIEIQAAKTEASRFKRFAQMNAFFALQKYLQEGQGARGASTSHVPADARRLLRQGSRARREGRHLHEQDAAGGRHALHGRLQLRAGARAALRHPLRDAGGPDHPVLRVQRRAGAPHGHRGSVLDSAGGIPAGGARRIGRHATDEADCVRVP